MKTQEPVQKGRIETNDAAPTTTARANRLEDIGALINNFRNQVMQTKYMLESGAEGADGWLETTQDVINYLYPRGLGTCPQTKKPLQHFIYDSVTCCLSGTKEAIQKQMAMSSHDFKNDPQPGVDSFKQ